MHDTAVQTTVTPTAAPPSDPVGPRRTPFRKRGPAQRFVTAVASLRVTVVLFALSLVLVFAGTLAQTDAGIWTVVSKYFRSFYVWIPFHIFLPSNPVGEKIPGGFPFPGGWLLGVLLLVNVLAAHALRFRFYWKDLLLLVGFAAGLTVLTRYESNSSGRLLLWCGISILAVTIGCAVPLHGKKSGILVLHSGLIVLLGGELVTGVFAREGNMSISEGLSSDYIEYADKCELAFVDSSGKADDHVIVVPQDRLRGKGRISDAALPFDLEVVKYMVNSALADPEPDGPQNLATAGRGQSRLAIEKSEVSGTDPNQKRDIPSIYARLYEKGTDRLVGTYLFSLWVNNQKLKAGDKEYDVALRFQREYKPYTFHLLEFRFDKYIGTSTAKNYSSRVRVVDHIRGEEREVTISMNSPLRFGGETFYQSGVQGEDVSTGTVLQVVRNPGWLLPYVSCAMVALGMLFHFGSYLLTFLRRRAV